MNDLAYVAAAYLVVLGGLAGYAIGLVRRGREAARRLSAIETRDRTSLTDSLEPPSEAPRGLDPASR